MRKTLIVLGAVLAAPASAQSTDCRWIGSTWSCNTQPSVAAPSAPNDYLGATGGTGPDYNDTVLKQQQIRQNRNTLKMQEQPENEARGMSAADVRLMLAAIDQCRKDKDKPLKEGWRDRTASEQRDYQMICLSYSLGRSHGQESPQP